LINTSRPPTSFNIGAPSRPKCAFKASSANWSAGCPPSGCTWVCANQTCSTTGRAPAWPPPSPSLAPSAPLVPLVPLVPSAPLVPLVPSAPLVPLVPLVPSAPLVPLVPSASSRRPLGLSLSSEQHAHVSALRITRAMERRKIKADTR
jgi:hypothetical protein